MDSCAQIRNAYAGFSKSQKRIADYFLQNAQHASGKTIDEVAERVGVSTATIVRFARSIGFSGYRDFIMRFTAAIPEDAHGADNMPNYLDAIPGDSIAQIMGHIYATSRQSIDQTMGVCDEASVALAVDKMRAAKRIDFFGMGASSIIAQDAQQKFLRINKVSYAFSSSHVQATATSTLTPEDVCVVISYSGETSDALRIAEISKDAGATVISITKFGDNSISRIADINLFVSSPESEFRSAATGSRISQLCVIDILYTSIVSLEYDRVKQYLDSSRKALNTRYKIK
ncbi:MAG: MurR/RpiR family transcriptional regulator [Defluviitaleaceae bacterium]|nr:MurR/RpiR family transcriptional regulator [Defluviitaleaceae bacterium]